MKAQSLFLFLSLLFFISCSKEKSSNENEKTTFELTFQLPENSSLKSSASDSIDLASLIISIENEKGELVYNNEEIKIYRMGDNFISKPISVNVGTFKIIHLLLANSHGTIVYATPLKESTLAYMVKTALPISFSVGKDQVLKITPEVLSTSVYNPTDFGYNTFSFQIINPINFQLSVFEYSEVAKNFILTDANLKISSTDSFNYQTSLLSKTNLITIPEKNGYYSIAVSKSGYTNFYKTISKDSIKLYAAKPLEIILSKEGAAPSLVAYYKFKGNLNDASGYANHGLYYGRGLYTIGINNDSISAIPLNGSTDYVKVKNSHSLNPSSGITVSAWIKPIDFVGVGSDPIVDKPYTSHISPFYQYHLAIGGSYGGNIYSFGFNVSVNNNYVGVNSGASSWQPNKWYFVTGTYDGKSIKIFVNGILRNSIDSPGTISTYNTDMFIGKMGNSDVFTPGVLDEIRIYNVALTEIEIKSIYQN